VAFLDEDLFEDDLENSCTCKNTISCLMMDFWEETCVELPALDVLARVFTRYDHDELRDLAADHPFIELSHDFLDIRFDLVVG
jgi:hypothetical protein